MKIKNYSVFFLLTVFIFQVTLHAQEIKGRMLFNDNWVFHKGDIRFGEIDGEAITPWQAVQLPHDWSIESPFSEKWASATGYLPGGIGWYKKTFTSEAAWRGKKIYIYFDGVYKNSEVWINGHHLGTRPNGFIPFQYELSPYINYQGKNLILVKADHSAFADSRWYTGSGIYRNVYLIVKNPVHVPTWGVAFSTPQVSGKWASINVKAEVTNALSVNTNCKLEMSLIDPQGKLAVNINRNLVLSKGSTHAEFKYNLAAPQLWSVDTPALYRLQIRLYRQGKMIDEITQAVGIRSIRFDKNDGFLLNNTNVKLKGVCIHDDAGALGVAVPREVWARRLAILKDAGVNALRLSHNPHADYLYDLCDEMGFLVMDEAFDEWEIGKNKWVKGWNVGVPSKDGYNKYFKEWAHRDLADMVKRGRNHPSIILWSIGNEIDYPNDPYSHPVLNTGTNPQIYGKGYLPDHPQASALSVIAKDLVKVIKGVDTTRPVTAALAGVVMSNEVGYPDVLDVVGYNYQEYRYKNDHQKYPERVIYGSENGMNRQAWDAVDTNKYISGQFLWTGIDYLGEAGKWPQRSNDAGLIDLGGFKKPEYFYRQSLWASKPMVYIAAKEASKTEERGIWSHRGVLPLWNWPHETKLNVECFTNCQEAELFLNGQSLGKQSRNASKEQIPSWNVDYQPGELLVKGYIADKVVSTYSLNTAGEVEKISVNPDRIIFPKSQRGISQIEIQVTDKNGNLVYTAEDDIHITITGEARLLGLESGSASSHEPYQASHRKAVHGKLIVYIETNGTAGNVNISFDAAGLQPATVKLTIK